MKYLEFIPKEDLVVRCEGTPEKENFQVTYAIDIRFKCQIQPQAKDLLSQTCHFVSSFFKENIFNIELKAGEKYKIKTHRQGTDIYTLDLITLPCRILELENYGIVLEALNLKNYKTHSYTSDVDNILLQFGSLSEIVEHHDNRIELCATLSS